MQVPLSAAKAIAVALAVAMALLLDVLKAAEFAASTTPVWPTARAASIASAAACRVGKPRYCSLCAARYTKTSGDKAETPAQSLACTHVGEVSSVEC